jgi:hypothetical protein
MSRFCKSLVPLAAALPLMLMAAFQAGAVAPGPRVSEDLNKHNLSSGVYNTSVDPSVRIGDRDSSITYRAKYYADGTNSQGRQVCIFCHTPHNANVVGQAPLWNRLFSAETFSRYSSATLQIRANPAASAPAQYGPGAQPDGSSKLCLSCHDGSTMPGRGLGDVLRGGPIEMANGNIITGIASFNPSTNKMKFGHHPVSFTYNGGVVNSVQYQISTARPGQGFRLPSQSPNAATVKLDKNNKMQCTTCHDPHQNKSDDDMCYWTAGGPGSCSNGASTGRKVAPFWVMHKVSNSASQDHDDVCTSCHLMNNPAPWPYP